MSYISKFTGKQVEDALGKAKTALQEHQDISGLATKEELKGKVDKVEGKQLSSEDFTKALKDKLEGLNNYDSTDLEAAVLRLRTDLDALVSGDTTIAIETFNEVIAFLDGISDTQDLSGIIASIEQQIAAKYSKPNGGIPKSDLSEEVKNSLNKADSALQEHQSLRGYATETYVANAIEQAITTTLNTEV